MAALQYRRDEDVRSQGHLEIPIFFPFLPFFLTEKEDDGKLNIFLR